MRTAHAKLACGIAIAFAGAAAWAVRDYARWRALGPGGLPATVRGWLKMTRFRLQAANELDVQPLLELRGHQGDVRAWGESIKRQGVRPTVSPYPIPHRQLTHLPDPAIICALQAMFDRKVRQHAGKVVYILSHFEKRTPAITLKHALGTVGQLSHGEIAHIHPSDNSMHMVLSASDAVSAIETGWAQRHGLAGRAVGLPATYVMVYAPRNMTDLRTVEHLLDAAIAYAVQPQALMGS